MATEARRAPRVASDSTSMAEAAAALREQGRRAALDALFRFKINDCTPFSDTAADIAHATLGKAHALTIALAIALNDGNEALRDCHAATCVDAIGDLIALAAFALEGAE